jgi:pantoate--beta-alanine ligase
MVRDLSFNVRIEAVATVREPDGLALSSRNAYLSPEERVQARALFRALRAGEQAVQRGEHDAGQLVGEMQRVLQEAPGLAPEYVAVLREEDLAEVDQVREPVVLALAARLGRTRLIDNLIVGSGAST